MTTISQLHLSRYELWFLLSHTTPATVVGFRNPTAGLLVEDTFPLIQEASFSLLNKDLIYVDVNNQIKIRDNLGTLLHTITTPQHTVLIAFQLNDDKKEKVRSFNFDGIHTTFLKELTDGSYNISQLESKEDLLSQVTEPFSDKVFRAPDTKPLHFLQDDIVLAQQLFEGSKVDEAKNYLDKARGEESSKLHLLETLQNPSIRFSLIGFMERNNPQKNYINGFSIVAGERYVWLFEIIDEKEKIVRVSKIALKDMNEKIISMMPFSTGG